MIFELAAWLGALLLVHGLKMFVMSSQRGHRTDRFTRVAGALGAVLLIVGLSGVAANRLFGR